MMDDDEEEEHELEKLLNNVCKHVGMFHANQ